MASIPDLSEMQQEEYAMTIRDMGWGPVFIGLTLLALSAGGYGLLWRLDIIATNNDPLYGGDLLFSGFWVGVFFA